MNWFRENRFLGTLLVVFGVALIAAIWFLFSAKGDWDDASTRFTNAKTELNRLERLAPYPSADNLRKMKAHAEDYSTALAKLKDELKTRVAPAQPMAPNEFQSHLRIALNAVVGRMPYGWRPMRIAGIDPRPLTNWLKNHRVRSTA